MTVRPEHGGLIYVMVLVSAANSAMTDRELYTMGEFVRLLPAFRGLKENALPKVAQHCAQRLGKQGLDR